MQFMMLCFVLLVIIGMLVDVTPAILIIVPILVPAARPSAWIRSTSACLSP